MTKRRPVYDKQECGCIRCGCCYKDRCPIIKCDCCKTECKRNLAILEQARVEGK